MIISNCLPIKNWKPT